MKRRSAGFSLIEALISLSLMSVLLGVVASLMHDTSTLMRQASQGDILPLQIALEQISADLRAAYQINQADAAGLELLKLDAGDSSRLPNPLPTPGPASFSLHAAASSLKLRYFQLGATLRCEVTYPNGDSEEYDVGDGIDGFTPTLINPGLIEVSVSHRDTSSAPVKVVSLTTQVVLHLPPLVVP